MEKSRECTSQVQHWDLCPHLPSSTLHHGGLLHQDGQVGFAPAVVGSVTQSDSIQCLNFAKKLFIRYSIQYCSIQDQFNQFKIVFN